MCRQFMVHPEDRDFQRILWRYNQEQSVKEYRLNTITYGTAASPFLAVRSLHQLASDECSKYPFASQVIKRDFYVDDVLSGAEDESQLEKITTELRNVCSAGGLELRKWASNSEWLIRHLPVELLANLEALNIDDQATVKTLGLQWKPQSDVFVFKVTLPLGMNTTKRSILSMIARLFDPIGWFAPFTVYCKIIMQELWLAMVGWDEQPPEHIKQKWNNVLTQLPLLETVQIPRLVLCAEALIELHGFCDASIRAYAACVYVRTIKPQCDPAVKLLCAKTRIAPLKQISLARLELCAAVLLTRLITIIQCSIPLRFNRIILWTDSTIVLAWISNSSVHWKPFVANRVAEIHSTISPQQWRYVPTKVNAADVASRGVLPHELINQAFWWSGPHFLQCPEDAWPVLQSLEPTTLEARKGVSIGHVTIIKDDIIVRYSSLQRLIRVIAYCRRFINSLTNGSSHIAKGSITVQENQEALIQLVKIVQRDELKELYDGLCKGSKIPHSYAKLNPFVDDQGVIRVGGRITHANVQYDHRHPILLPKYHHLIKLIVQDYHKMLLHPGSELLLSMIRQKFWIMGGRSTVRHYTHQCLRCFRDRVNASPPLMGNLPRSRIVLTRAFLKVGTDLGGPFSLKTKRGRGGQIIKGYIIIFICLATKAVHLELTPDLTTDSFLSAFKRLVSRRGKCQEVHSDNGTNLVGANSELRRLRQFVVDETIQNQIKTYAVEQNIEWKFIPPRAPHFGGLWEAGIKSAKRHLRRILGNVTLTYEEMYTVLTEIEACLNSRPICPLSSDPQDLEALTPGHFLVGTALKAIPEPNLIDVQLNRLQRWQVVQQLAQHFWRRWHQEYLSTLQQRPKWYRKGDNLQINDLVILKEDNIPPMKWPLGRIVEVHPGSDNIVRVVTLKTATQQCVNYPLNPTQKSSLETTFQGREGYVVICIRCIHLFLVVVYLFCYTFSVISLFVTAAFKSIVSTWIFKSIVITRLSCCA